MERGQPHHLCVQSLIMHRTLPGIAIRNPMLQKSYSRSEPPGRSGRIFMNVPLTEYLRCSRNVFLSHRLNASNWKTSAHGTPANRSSKVGASTEDQQQQRRRSSFKQEL